MKFSLILALCLFLTPVAASATSSGWYWTGHSETTSDRDSSKSRLQLLAKKIIQDIRVHIDEAQIERIKVKERNDRYTYLVKLFKHVKGIEIDPRPWPKDEGTSPVPEPTAALLFGMGALVVGHGVQRRRAS